MMLDKFVVNRGSLKLELKDPLCCAVNVCESWGAWAGLLTPKDHSCALIEYVHEC